MSDKPQLIGLTGKAGAGKDTLAARLHEHDHYVRYAYADPLREILNDRFGWAPRMWEDRIWKESVSPRGEAGPFSPRSWMQWLGTEVLREVAGYDIFVRLAFEEWDKQPYPMVISDVRFTNEAVAIINRGGLIIEVVRDGLEPVNLHVSERGVPSSLINATVANNGTPEQLYHHAMHLIKAIWEAHNKQLELPLTRPTVHDLFDRHPGNGA